MAKMTAAQKRAALKYQKTLGTDQISGAVVHRFYCRHELYFAKHI